MRTQLINHLSARLNEFNVDELRTLAIIADRLYMGRKQYGALDLANDSRDWREEWRQELVDGLIYSVFRKLSEEDK
jgi:hypothetical protein